MVQNRLGHLRRNPLAPSGSDKPESEHICFPSGWILTEPRQTKQPRLVFPFDGPEIPWRARLNLKSNLFPESRGIGIFEGERGEHLAVAIDLGIEIHLQNSINILTAARTKTESRSYKARRWPHWYSGPFFPRIKSCFIIRGKIVAAGARCP